MRLFDREASHHIVIFRALQLGDLLCTVPAFRALRATFPHARVTLIGLPWAESFVRRFPSYLDEFIAFPGWPGLPEQKPRIEQIPTFLELIQRRGFDLALQMQGSGLFTNPMIGLFGAKRVAGHYLPGQYCPDEALFQVYPEGQSEIRTYLRLLSRLGIPSQGEQLEFPVTAQERAAFEQFSREQDLQASYVCLHPGARAESRRWPTEKFAAVGDALAQMGYQVVLTGTHAELELANAVAQAMHVPTLNIAGKTDLGVLALLIANARLLVSNDTGVSHIAAAFETPSVILYTVSEIERWRPLNHSLHRAIPNAQDLAPEQVLAEARSLLKEINTYANEPL